MHPSCKGIFCNGATVIAVFVLLLLTTLPATTGQNCTASGQQEALMQLYNKTANVTAAPGRWTYWGNTSLPCVLNQTRNGTVVTTVNAPSHCCWGGVKCCVTRTRISGLAILDQCTTYQCNCTLGTVTGLFMQLFGVSGSPSYIFDDGFLSAMGCSLRVMIMNNNKLNGTLPPQLQQLSQLEILSLGSNGKRSPVRRLSTFHGHGWPTEL